MGFDIKGVGAYIHKGLNDAAKTADRYNPLTDKGRKNIGNDARNTANGAASNINGAVNNVKAATGNNIRSARNTVDRVVNRVDKEVNKVKTAVDGNVNRVTKDVRAAAGNNIRSARNTVDRAVNRFDREVNKVKTAVDSNVNRVTKDVRAAAGNNIRSARNTVDRAVKKVDREVNNVKTGTRQNIKAAGNTLGAAGNTVKSATRYSVNAVGSFVGGEAASAPTINPVKGQHDRNKMNPQGSYNNSKGLSTPERPQLRRKPDGNGYAYEKRPNGGDTKPLRSGETRNVVDGNGKLVQAQGQKNGSTVYVNQHGRGYTLPTGAKPSDYKMDARPDKYPTLRLQVQAEIEKKNGVVHKTPDGTRYFVSNTIDKKGNRVVIQINADGTPEDGHKARQYKALKSPDSIFRQLNGENADRGGVANILAKGQKMADVQGRRIDLAGNDAIIKSSWKPLGGLLSMVGVNGLKDQVQNFEKLTAQEQAARGVNGGKALELGTSLGVDVAFAYAGGGVASKLATVGGATKASSIVSTGIQTVVAPASKTVFNAAADGQLNANTTKEVAIQVGMNLAGVRIASKTIGGRIATDMVQGVATNAAMGRETTAQDLLRMAATSGSAYTGAKSANASRRQSRDDKPASATANPGEPGSARPRAASPMEEFRLSVQDHDQLPDNTPQATRKAFVDRVNEARGESINARREGRKSGSWTPEQTQEFRDLGNRADQIAANNQSGVTPQKTTRPTPGETMPQPPTAQKPAPAGQASANLRGDQIDANLQKGSALTNKGEGALATVSTPTPRVPVTSGSTATPTQTQPSKPLPALMPGVMPAPAPGSAQATSWSSNRLQIAQTGSGRGTANLQNASVASTVAPQPQAVRTADNVSPQPLLAPAKNAPITRWAADGQVVSTSHVGNNGQKTTTSPHDTVLSVEKEQRLLVASRHHRFDVVDENFRVTAGIQQGNNGKTTITKPDPATGKNTVIFHDRIYQSPMTKVLTSTNPRTGAKVTSELNIYAPGMMPPADLSNAAATVKGGNNRSYGETSASNIADVLDSAYVFTLKPNAQQKFGAVSSLKINHSGGADYQLPPNSAYWGQVVGGAKDPDFWYDSTKKAPDPLQRRFPANALGEGEKNMTTPGALDNMLPEVIAFAKQKGQERLFFYTTEPGNIKRYSDSAKSQLDAGNVSDWRMSTITKDGKTGYNYELYLNGQQAPAGSKRPMSQDDITLPPTTGIPTLAANPRELSGRPEWDAIDMTGKTRDQFIDATRGARNSQQFTWRDPVNGKGFEMRGDVTLALPAARFQNPDGTPFKPATAPTLPGVKRRQSPGVGIFRGLVNPVPIGSGATAMTQLQGSLPLSPARQQLGNLYQGTRQALRAYDQFNSVLPRLAGDLVGGKAKVKPTEQQIIRNGGLPPAEPLTGFRARAGASLQGAANTVTDAINDVFSPIPRALGKYETPLQEIATKGTVWATNNVADSLSRAQGVVFNPTTGRMAVAATQAGLINFGGNILAGNYTPYVNVPTSAVPQIAAVMNLPKDGRFTGITLDPKSPVDNFVGVGWRLPSMTNPISVRESTISRGQATSGRTNNPMYGKTHIARTFEGAGGVNVINAIFGGRGLVNVTIGGAAANPPYLTTGNVAPKDPNRVPAVGLAGSVAPVQVNAILGFVTGPVMPALRVAYGAEGVLGTARSTSGVKVDIGTYQLPVPGTTPGGLSPAVLSNPAWGKSLAGQFVDGLITPPERRPMAFPVNGSTSPEAVQGSTLPRVPPNLNTDAGRRTVSASLNAQGAKLAVTATPEQIVAETRRLTAEGRIDGAAVSRIGGGKLNFGNVEADVLNRYKTDRRNAVFSLLESKGVKLDPASTSARALYQAVADLARQGKLTGAEINQVGGGTYNFGNVEAARQRTAGER